MSLFYSSSSLICPYFDSVCVRLNRCFLFYRPLKETEIKPSDTDIDRTVSCVTNFVVPFFSFSLSILFYSLFVSIVALIVVIRNMSFVLHILPFGVFFLCRLIYKVEQPLNRILYHIRLLLMPFHCCCCRLEFCIYVSIFSAREMSRIKLSSIWYDCESWTLIATRTWKKAHTHRLRLAPMSIEPKQCSVYIWLCVFACSKGRWMPPSKYHYLYLSIHFVGLITFGIFYTSWPSSSSCIYSYEIKFHI